MTNRNSIRKLILDHFEKYPLMEIRDIFKLIYQSSYGCEHLVTDENSAVSYIKKEYEAIESKTAESDSLGEGYERVHLSWLDCGMKPETLGRLFCMSAKKEESGAENLKASIEITKELIKERLLPYSEEDFDSELKKWEEESFSAVHHSDTFRESYSPAYRVIAKKYVPFLPLFSKIDKHSEKERLIVAIDGSAASGKSTLAKILEEIYPCTVFHMDDFFLRPEQRTPERYNEAGGNVDRERFLSEVLIPLSKGCDIDYVRFDCQSFTLCPPERITPKRLVIIEGSYSMHPALSDFYDISVYLDVSPALQRNRISKRNSKQMQERFFNEWIPLESVYFEKMKVRQRCDLIIPITE